MRFIHGLELRVVPARISSRTIGPLVNAAFDLEQKVVSVGMCSRSSVSDRTTVSVRAMTVMGIGEKCS
jgi:hypothetical protein